MTTLGDEHRPGPGPGDSPRTGGHLAGVNGPVTTTAPVAPAPVSAAPSGGPGAVPMMPGADGAGGAEGEGMSAMPMMGDAGGQSEQDRQREAWMHEDDDIWGVPSGNGTPPLLG